MWPAADGLGVLDELRPEPIHLSLGMVLGHESVHVAREQPVPRLADGADVVIHGVGHHQFAPAVQASVAQRDDAVPRQAQPLGPAAPAAKVSDHEDR